MLPDGRDTYQTFVGFLLSVFTALILLSYGSYQFAKLSEGTDYVVQQRNLENKFGSNEIFGLADQFTVAASLWARG